MATTFKSADLTAMDRTVRGSFTEAFTAKEGYAPWWSRVASHCMGVALSDGTDGAAMYMDVQPMGAIPTTAA